jgi:UDP-glucose 4-epimerase
MSSNNFFVQKRILVTGGAGFIGSVLVTNLVKQGAFVTVLDNLSSGSMENITSVIKDIVFIHGDITNFQTCLAATQNQSLIFHLAAMASVPESMIQPRMCFNINIKGLYNLLESARMCRSERFIFSSSAAVYGNHEGPCTEQQACTPQSPYGVSKYIGEQLCNHYYALFNVRSLCLRYFNVYDDRPINGGTGVYSRFKTAIKNNESVTVFGDGSQSRDFVSVSEIVKANILLAQLPFQHLTGQPINIASGNSQSLTQIIDLLKQENPESTSTICYQPARSGDIQHSAANIEKYRQLQALV